MMEKHRIYVSRSGRNLGSPSAYRVVKKAAAAALEAEKADRPCLINVVLTNDKKIQEINCEFRDVDKPTDVLSFPMNEFEPGRFDAEKAEIDEETGLVILGDMVLSLERARAQGNEYGHGEEREIAYLTVHSVLHLLGYDHVDEGPLKRQMRYREEAIMKGIGLSR